MLAEVDDELCVHKLRGCCGENDLTSVGGRGHAGSEVNVVADIALARYERCARVQADPDLDRAGRELLSERSRRIKRAGCRRKGIEESIPLGVDLDAALRGARLPDHSTMLGERLGVSFGPEFVQLVDPRRREEENP